VPRPRKEQINLEITRNYHLMGRCVRRAFLCGKDGDRSYEHRREWIESLLKNLVEVFAIQLYGYAIMSNHYHLVARVCDEEAANWSDREVVRRWRMLYRGNHLGKRFLEGGNLSTAEYEILKPLIEEWRNRLCDIGWFMKFLNENCSGQVKPDTSLSYFH